MKMKCIFNGARACLVSLDNYILCVKDYWKCKHQQLNKMAQRFFKILSIHSNEYMNLLSCRYQMYLQGAKKLHTYLYFTIFMTLDIQAGHW